MIPAENRRREQNDTAEGHHLPAEGCTTAARQACYLHGVDLVNAKRVAVGKYASRIAARGIHAMVCTAPIHAQKRVVASMQTSLA
jgi:hypothetical protein